MSDEPSEVLIQAYRYDASKNPDGGNFPGVPLADLTAEQVAGFPLYIQRSIARSAMYAPVAVATAAARQRKIGPTETKADE